MNMETLLVIFLIIFVLWVFAANANDRRRSRGNFTTSEFLTMYFDAEDRARKKNKDQSNNNRD
jgi:hypothetical protein